LSLHFYRLRTPRIDVPNNSKSSGIGLFLLLTLIISSVFWTLIIASGHVRAGKEMYAVALMWSPAAAALLTCFLRGEGIQGLGWRWGEWRWARMAYLIPLSYAAIAYVIVWSTGLGGFGNVAFLHAMPALMGFPRAPVWLSAILYVAMTATIGLIASVSRAVGEEIGWRGFLAPALVKRFGFTSAVLFGGAIWGVWHLPVLLFADYNGGTPWWFGMPCFMVNVIANCVLTTWLRLRSGSVWPAAILHASHNLFVQSIFTPVTASREWFTPYAVDEFGFVLPLVEIAFAVALWLRRGELVGHRD
jgi:membrane protease YdiL (CAAX protease family)